MPRAPLWERNATRPAGGHVVANVPFSRMSGSVFTTPMQFGPIKRIPEARHTSRSSCWSDDPSGPVSANPDEITTSPRTPLLPHSRATAITESAGTAMNATSTSPGTSSTLGYAAMPCTTAALGLTACTTPANGGASRL